LKTSQQRDRSLWPLAGVSVAIGICLFGQLGAVGLTGPDEPRYVWIARAMVRTGDWVTPRLYGQPWFEKPILYYWAAAIGFRLKLPAEWAARLPSAFAALATALAIAWLARRFYDTNENWARNPALIAPLIFSTSVAAIGFARAATPDMLFSASIGLAMACAAEIFRREGAIGQARCEGTRHFFSGGASASARSKVAFVHPLTATRRKILWLLLLGAFLGLGTLAKGPAAVILAGGAVLLWALATRRWREALWLLHPAAIAAFCAVALPWYVVCAMRNPDFLRVFILQHNFERYLTPMFQHRQPFWFFGPIFLAALLPWTILLWPAAQEGLRRWKQKSWRDSPGFFFACWAMFPILFFSASESKLPSYILPAMAPAALICAVAGTRAFERGGKALRPVALGLMATWIALAIGAFVYLRRINWQAGNPFATTHGTPAGIYAGVALLLAAAVAIAAGGLRGKAAWAIGVCALCMVASVEAANIAVLPLVGGRYSARTYAEFLKNDPRPDRIFMYQLPRAWVYGLNFYFGRELPEWSAKDPDPAFVLATPKGLAEIRRMGRSSGELDLTQGGQQSLIYVPVNAAARGRR
jgi:4-amino-4-deoxy-L-arabinose transferase-like glycosyltransferase